MHLESLSVVLQSLIIGDNLLNLSTTDILKMKQAFKNERITIIIIIVCVLKSAAGNLNVSNYSQTQTEKYYPGEGRQLSDNFGYSSNSLSYHQPSYKHKSRSLVKTGKIKMRLVDNNPIMSSDESYPAYVSEEDKHKYNYLPVMPMYRHGTSNEYRHHQELPLINYDHQNYMMQEIEAKEAALKGFAIGLAAGLGAIGSISGLFLKFLLIPLLALGTFFPLLLLLLSTRIPVISTGKMLLRQHAVEAVKKDSKLQEVVEEIVKKLPEIMKSHAKGSKKTT